MPQFYGTIERHQTWNVTVDADTEEEAEQKLYEMELAKLGHPDYSYEESYIVEVVKGYHE